MTTTPSRPPVHTTRVGGLDVGYLEAGEGPLVVVLHGFPDTAFSFVPLLDRLADAGYRAVAPFLRGYAPTALAPDGDYSIDALAGDLLGLIDALGDGPTHVVGHDWGAAIAQYAANVAPDRFDRLVLAGLPHLRKFFLEAGPRQLRRSHYIVRFQAPRWAERRLPKDDFRWMEEVLVRRWSPGWDYTAADIAPVKENFADPARLKAALAYYRGIPALLVNRGRLRTAFAPVAVPTRMIYGPDDGAIGPEMFQGQEPRFSGEFDLCEATGRGHFMQAEDPEWFAARVIEFLRG